MRNKIIFKFIGLFLVILSSSSCIELNSPVGKWDDIIELSQKDVQFSAENNSILITTEGEWWWINHISFNGVINPNLVGIDLTANNFVISENEYQIERKNGTEIHIEMTKNLTGLERKLIVNLEAGDYFDTIIITQSAD